MWNILWYFCLQRSFLCCIRYCFLLNRRTIIIIIVFLNLIPVKFGAWLLLLRLRLWHLLSFLLFLCYLMFLLDNSNRSFFLNWRQHQLSLLLSSCCSCTRCTSGLRLVHLHLLCSLRHLHLGSHLLLEWKHHLVHRVQLLIQTVIWSDLHFLIDLTVVLKFLNYFLNFCKSHFLSFVLAIYTVFNFIFVLMF
jgi:hypothetical protein